MQFHAERAQDKSSNVGRVMERLEENKLPIEKLGKTPGVEPGYYKEQESHIDHHINRDKRCLQKVK